MRKRDIFKAFCFMSYIVLLVLFFAFSKVNKRIPDQAPCADLFCLRLCDTKENSKFLNESLDDFEVTNPVTNISHKYEFLSGNPCERMKFLENDQWKFSSIGSISVNDSSFSESKYCLEYHEEDENETESHWSLMVCDDFSEIYWHLHAILSIAAIAILALALLLYSFINELKNLNGKCVIGFLLSLILACAYSRIELIDDYLKIVLINFSLIFVILWINVLIFDVWWTLSFFDSSSGGKFKFYLIYVIGWAAVSFIIALVFMKFLEISYAFLLLIGFICFFCFVCASLKIYEMINEAIDFGQKRFHHEQQRFLTYLQLFVLIIVTWTIEFCSRSFAESHESFIIADVLLCIQSIFVFIVLVLKRSVREVIIRNVCCC